MIKEIFLALTLSMGLFASCSNKKFKQALVYKHPAITLADKIDSIVIAKMNLYNIPGLSIGIIKSDSIIYTKGYGVISINKQKPVTENSVFHTASVSKIFTALAVMNLVENKQLSLEDKLLTILPNCDLTIKGWGAITIRTLLNHTSGIADVNSYQWSNNNQANNSLENYLLNEDFELEFEPSSKYKYCNLGL
jgi:CubicO group peptidase (beta-lactamase class C family)